MSIERVASVLEAGLDGRLDGVPASERLLLIGIANHDGDGGAWPKIETLAAYVGVKPRQIRKLRENLEERGLLKVHYNEGGTRKTRDDSRPNLYKLTLGDGRSSRPSRDEETGGPVEPPAGGPVGPPNRPLEPSLRDPSLNEMDRAPSLDLVLVDAADIPGEDSRRERRAQIWQTLEVLFGKPPPTRRTLYGRVAKYLLDEDATPEEILFRAGKIVELWDNRSLTITSLETHWSRWNGLAGQLKPTDRDRTARLAANRSVVDEIRSIGSGRTLDA